MVTARFVLVLVAVVLFGLVALGVTHSRVNLLAAGLFCWALAVLLG